MSPLRSLLTRIAEALGLTRRAAPASFDTHLREALSAPGLRLRASSLERSLRPDSSAVEADGILLSIRSHTEEN